jgi:very-short-patch-repair endonuclease
VAGQSRTHGRKSRRGGLVADQILARLARRAHGVVTRRQLLDAGVTDEEIEGRLRTGSLHRQHPGVYRVGHEAPSLEARYLAAVLSCGDDALLSGRSAAFLLGLIRGTPPPPEVTASTDRRVRGVKNRRSRRFDAITRMEWKGIPVTSVAQTLVDLAAVLSEGELARACHEAGVRHRTTPRQVQAALDRYPRVPGAAKLRRVIGAGVPVTLSELERRFLRVLREAGLPLPHTNRPVAARRVDCIWEDRRLIVELDSYRFHSSRHAWEQDRRREREARARGYEFRRYTYGDVFELPELMLRELRELLD